MKTLSILALILICISCCNLQKTIHGNHITEKALTKNRVASKILRDFSQTYMVPPSGNSTCTKPIYPNYFGGQYINNCNKAVIYITDKKYKKKILERTGNNKVLIRTCKHSYNSLDSLMEQLWNIIREDAIMQQRDSSSFSCMKHFKIHTFILDEIHNRINIYMDNHSRRNVKEFRQKILNSPGLHFPKQASYFIKE